MISVDCQYWNKGECGQGQHGGKPTLRQCANCLAGKRRPGTPRRSGAATGVGFGVLNVSPGPPDCKHWLANGSRRGGVCSIAYYGERPTFGVCAHCLSNGGPKIRGAGDLVSVTIDRVIGAKAHQKVKQIIGGKKGCGCKKRQDQLNDIIPIGSGKK